MIHVIQCSDSIAAELVTIAATWQPYQFSWWQHLNVRQLSGLQSLTEVVKHPRIALSTQRSKHHTPQLGLPCLQASRKVVRQCQQQAATTGPV